MDRTRMRPSGSRGADEMPFAIHDLTISHRDVEQGALVFTARSPMVVGRARIAQLRTPSDLSKVERWMIEQAKIRGERARIVIFRAVNERGERVWEFDPTLSERELEEGGLVLTKALIPLHRRLMAAGVVLMLHTDWGLRDCYALRHGIRKALDELQDAPGPIAQADRWVWTHMLLHVALDLDHVTTSLLPEQLTMIERRWPRVRDLVAQLPSDAID
jgi:hypothetical protein